MNLPRYPRGDAPVLADSAAKSAGLRSTRRLPDRSVAVPLRFGLVPAQETPVEKIKRKKLIGDSLIVSVKSS
jgi:hypothetical protein